MHKRMILALLCCALLFTSSCTVMQELTVSTSAVQPDLQLLDHPPYEEESVPAASAAQDAGAPKVDLWLDATQLMGGINPNEESMYPHSSRKYREGGFHYRYEEETGLYESLLRSMLTAAQGSRVRLLRYGNERLSDRFLVSERLLARDASPDAFRSIRRDLLTFAVDPLSRVFSAMSAEKMDKSFYALGARMLNQIEAIDPLLLENPDQAGRMSIALREQIHAIDRGDEAFFSLKNDTDYPLLYALNNIDLSRLSVITCDPATIRSVTDADAHGAQTELIRTVLEERGVFDSGLSVGVYAFTLDYMGQMISFGPVDLSEPLVWGRLAYSPRKNLTEGTLPMPRTLLTLVIGQPEQVDSFVGALNSCFETEPVYRELRGPTNGELRYNMNGETVIQEPFAFQYEYTQIERPRVECLTQHTPGVFAVSDGSAVQNGPVQTIVLSPDENGVHPDRSLSLTLPLSTMPSDLTLTAEGLLLHDRTVKNTADFVSADDEQSIVLRDQIYVFAPQNLEESPFSLSGSALSDEGLTISLQAAGSVLKPGYYRLTISGDLTEGALKWETPDWIGDLSTSFTKEQIAEWEDFSALLSQYEPQRDNPSLPYQHAWGDADNRTYRGTPVPVCPPVTQAPDLSGLVEQIHAAADVKRSPYIRYVFDVFVTGGAM